ncbi:MAG: hypothetical protein HZB53_10625 [Chloroflexi bacterium]|nr:hypothetical protein [Chloroflexota bacterium]
MLSLVALAGCDTAPPGANGAPDEPSATRIPRATSTPTVRRAPSQQSGPLSGLVRVDAGDDWFLPEVVTITVGTTVRWYHVGEEAHNAFAIDGSWGTPEFGIGSTTEHRFNSTGRYPYQCTLHAPGMSGIIVVVPK